MEIIQAVKHHTVTDYEFMFVSGSKLTITLDIDLGDSITESSDRYVIKTVKRPGLPFSEDQDEASEGESLEVFKTGLAAISAIARKQRQPTNEELLELQSTIKQFSKTVQ